MIISPNEARSFIVESQMLNTGPKSGRYKRTLNVFERLGYVQIDTISVVTRAHHHVLWSRVPNYKRNLLSKLESDRNVFEYWAHAASYLPMHDFRYSLIPKQKIKAGPGHWWPRDTKWTSYVYDKIKAEGPLMSKDFQKDPTLAHDHPWGGHPVTQAVRQLFMEGELMISGRKGFQKIYDLTERVIPDSVNTSTPSKEEYYKYLIHRDLKANGIMRDVEIGHLISIPPKALKSILVELEEAEILIKTRVGKKSNQTYYILKDHFEQFFSRKRRRRLHLLSPFDNLVIQRKRLKELFSFEYVLECYVPKAKRKIGYYSLPILWGTNFVGQIDLKADRKNKELIIRSLVWEKNVRKADEFETLFKKLIRDYADFNGCSEIICTDHIVNQAHPFPIEF